MKNFLSTNECAKVLKAMSDETRLRIIRCLFQGEKCGTEIAEELELPQPHIAHHLGILRNSDLVSSERNGQRVCYKLHPAVYESLRKDRESAINLGCCKISFKT